MLARGRCQDKGWISKTPIGLLSGGRRALQSADCMGFEERRRGSCTDVGLMIGQALRRGCGLLHEGDLGYRL